MRQSNRLWRACAGAIMMALLSLAACSERKPPSNEDPFGHARSSHGQKAPTFRGSGTVMSIDEIGRTIRIDHTALPALKLGAGTTTFRYIGDIPGGITAGINVSFEIELQKGQPVIIGLGSPLAG